MLSPCMGQQHGAAAAYQPKLNSAGITTSAARICMEARASGSLWPTCVLSSPGRRAQRAAAAGAHRGVDRAPQRRLELQQGEQGSPGDSTIDCSPCGVGAAGALGSAPRRSPPRRSGSSPLSPEATASCTQASREVPVMSAGGMAASL